MTPSFHNTINLQPDLFAAANASCLNQEERVANWFIANRGREYTPPEIALYVFGNRVPLTSVRRAISNLTDRGLLVKTENKRPGLYGMDNSTWRLA